MGRVSKKFFSSSVIKKKSVTSETFLIEDKTLDGGSDTLSQSYRIPYSVHKVAEGIVKRIRRRVVKNYEPRQEMGEVGYYRDIMDIDLSEGSWLIMAQAGYMLEPVAQYLKSFG